MPDERSRRIEKAVEDITGSAQVKDATQLRGKVRIVTSSTILKLINDIVAAHAGETNKELLTKVTEADFELLKLRNNARTLRDDLERAREESFAKDATIKDLTEQLAHALATANRRESDVRRLSGMIQARDKEHSTQIKRLQAYLKKLKSEQEAKTDTEEVKALREEAATLQSELRMSEDIEEMQRSEIANLEERIEKIRADYETQISNLSRKIDLLERELRTSRELEKKFRSKLSKLAKHAKPIDKSADEFSKTAMQLGYCTMEHVQEGLQIQEDIAEMGLAPPKLSDVLVDKGHITAGQATDILRVQGTSRPRIEGYEFVSKLGEGLLGATYKAKQLSLDRDVAIKVIRRELTADKDYTTRFLEQAKQVGRLHHKNVVHVIDAGEINGIYYCISEYVRGQNLREILRKKKKLTERQALHIGLEIASAMVEAQKYGLVHGDIKPSNILVNIEGVVKVCDLGLASQINLETEFALPYNLYQSAYYISPEVVRAGKPDARSDIYSLGATLFRLATGSYPFGKATTPREAMLAHLNSSLPDPREKNTGISQEVAQIIMRMLEPQPEDRYQTPKEMVSAFVNLVKERKPAGSGREAPRRRHTRKRHR